MSEEKKWEVKIKVDVVLHVEADDRLGAEMLGMDSLSSLRALSGWKDCVTIVDGFWEIDEVTEVREDSDG